MPTEAAAFTIGLFLQLTFSALYIHYSNEMGGGGYENSTSFIAGHGGNLLRRLCSIKGGRVKNDSNIDDLKCMIPF